MQNQNFPDGFPMDAQAAINNSYFLTNEEKNEWTEWLKQANLEQQNELVNTLHDIWIENQKQVIPAGFDTKNSSTPNQSVTVEPKSESVAQAQNTTPKVEQPVVNNAVPTSETQQSVKTTIEEVQEVKTEIAKQPIQENISEEEVVIEKQAEVKEVVAPEVPGSNESARFSNNQRSENRNNTVTGNQTPVSNTNPRSETTQRSNPNQQRPQRNQDRTQSTLSEQNRERNQNRNDRSLTRNEGRAVNSDRVVQNNQEIYSRESNASSKKSFNLTSARAVATNEELTKLVQTYQLQQKSLQAARLQYEESLQKKEAQTEASFLSLMTRSIEILSQFEGVTDYISGMQEKLLKMNEIIIQQSKENSETRNEIRSEVIEIKDNYDRIERDSSSNYRDLKDFKTETRRTLQDLLAQQNTKTVDAYGGEGVKGQIELLEAKIALLEKKIEQSQTTSNNPRNVYKKPEPVKFDKPESNKNDRQERFIRQETKVETVNSPEINNELNQEPVKETTAPAPQTPQQRPQQHRNNRIQKPQRPERPTRPQEKPQEVNQEVNQEESVIDLSDLI